jgi:hypothetical protein
MANINEVNEKISKKQKQPKAKKIKTVEQTFKFKFKKLFFGVGKEFKKID